VTVWLPSVRSISCVSRRRRGDRGRGGFQPDLNAETSAPHPGTVSGFGAPAPGRCRLRDGGLLCSDSDSRCLRQKASQKAQRGGSRGRFCWSPARDSWLGCGDGARGASLRRMLCWGNRGALPAPASAQRTLTYPPGDTSSSWKQSLFPVDGSFRITGLMCCPPLGHTNDFKSNSKSLKKPFVAFLGSFTLQNIILSPASQLVLGPIVLAATTSTSVCPKISRARSSRMRCLQTKCVKSLPSAH